MPVNKDAYDLIRNELGKKNITLVAVSKTKTVEDIFELYNLGQRDFGENYVQELVNKAAVLPQDIRWHFIGHLQSNKIKSITFLVHLIQVVDSLKLLKKINQEGIKSGRVIDCLLQIHIAQEETKFGLDEEELNELIGQYSDPGRPGQVMQMLNVQIVGLMGMASFTDNMDKVRKEFQQLKRLFERLRTHDSGLTTLSMGMSSDYKVAIEEGSTMVRIGSLLFGERSN